jgi:transposase
MADEDKVASIDIHKKVLMVVVGSREGEAIGRQSELERRRFGTMTGDLRRLSAGLRERKVKEVVMESTAQYWKPVWMELEPYMRLHLAQAFSNRAPKGRKGDFRDAERLLRRFLAGELILSFVPDPEQRGWRTMTRMKTRLARHRVRLYSHVEDLLEEMRIKLSCVLSDLFGASGLRILHALAKGETDPKKLAALGDDRLKCTDEQLVDALTGNPQATHLEMLGLYLDQLQLVDKQMAKLSAMISQALRPHQEAVARLAEVPGFGPDSAQQVIAEVGVRASSFPSARSLASWVGTCPGENESAEENHSSRSPKGNRYMRRILAEAAQAAVKAKGSHFQAVFRRFLPRLDYNGAIWAVAHRLCRLVWKILHDGVRYVEQGAFRDPKARKRRAQALAQALRRLGYNVQITPIEPTAAPA